MHSSQFIFPLYVIGLKTLSQLKSDKVIIALVSTVHVLVALSSTLEANSTDSLSTQHCAKFESNTNRMTFETNTICTTSDIQALQSCVIIIFSHGIIRTKGKSILNLLFTKNIGPRANNQKGIKVIGPRTNNFF